MHEKKWRQANNVLLIAIILINGYVISAPFIPGVWFWWQNRDQSKVEAFTERLKPGASSAPSKPAANKESFRAGPEKNGLIIPKMLLETPIVDGPQKDSYSLLNAGAWRLPFSSSPGKSGNTVIAGHRFSYTGPHGVFYYLNKLTNGDDIGLWYNGTLYTYKVTSSQTVAPTEISVQQETSDTRLTLYTCTPLWNPTNRLVVVAKPFTSEVSQ